MKKTVSLGLLAAGCLAVGILAFSQSGNDPLDALKICGDTQKLVFENRYVRVIDNQVPVGGTEPLHDHPHGVVIYLAHSKNEVTTQDGKTRISENAPGTAAWSEATVHSMKNMGDAPTHTIRIDVKY
jgi:hypothetical protein